MAEYYAALTSGDSWTGATLHTDPECVDGNPSPLPAFVAEHDSTAFCPECTDMGIDIDPAESAAERDIAGIINLGICPWCEREFENVGSHAAQVHPDEWAAYRNR